MLTIRYNTYMSKLTLSVDERVVLLAKRYAKRQGVSVSAMVESYLAAVAGPARTAPHAPILHSLRGSLKKADRRDYTRHLVKKYR